MTTLEVKDDGLIYVVKDCPPEPQPFPPRKGSNLNEDMDKYYQSVLDYPKALASCERIKCADQQQANRLILQFNNFASEPNIQFGLYQVPVEWEKDDRRLPHYPVVAILKESPKEESPFKDFTPEMSARLCKPIHFDTSEESPKEEESQEELWKYVMNIAGRRADKRQFLMKHFTLTRKP